MQHDPTIPSAVDPETRARAKLSDAARKRQARAVGKLAACRFEAPDAKLRKAAVVGLRNFSSEFAWCYPTVPHAAQEAARAFRPLGTVFIEYRQYVRRRAIRSKVNALREVLTDTLDEGKALRAALAVYAESQSKDARTAKPQTFVLRRVVRVLADWERANGRVAARNLTANWIADNLLGAFHVDEAAASLVSHALTGTGLRRSYTQD